MTQQKKQPAGGYVAVLGFNHDPSKTRVEPEEDVPATVPESVVKTLLRDGVIREKAAQDG